ncbi:MAG: YtxH domain-containing protein [Candidatus Cryptobacteroides sp.]
MRGNSLFALVAGAAIGVAAGILLAPDKGSETRKKIKEMASEGGEKAKEGADKLREEISSLKDLLSKEGSHLKEEGKSRLLEQLKKLEKALSGYEDDIEEQVAEEA